VLRQVESHSRSASYFPICSQQVERIHLVCLIGWDMEHRSRADSLPLVVSRQEVASQIVLGPTMIVNGKNTLRRGFDVIEWYKAN
jgi:hypothetical protein